MAIDVKERYYDWLAASKAAVYRTMLTGDESYYYYKAKAVVGGVKPALGHCERDTDCRISCAPDRVAFELNWMRSADKSCWHSGVNPSSNPTLDALIALFNIDRVKTSK